VKDDDTVTVRNIKIGPADADRTSVSSGLAVGEKVVIDGADRLREGAKVAVRNGPAPGAAQASGADQASPPPAAGGSDAQGADQSQPDQGGQHRHKGHRSQDQSTPAANPP
jgi:multidrug efflux system membrane fusion protein